NTGGPKCNLCYRRSMRRNYFVRCGDAPGLRKLLGLTVRLPVSSSFGHAVVLSTGRPAVSGSLTRSPRVIRVRCAGRLYLEPLCLRGLVGAPCVHVVSSGHTDTPAFAAPISIPAAASRAAAQGHARRPCHRVACTRPLLSTCPCLGA